ncbi:hypothetical protein [Magnetospirillum sp. LM-5]|uniref:hypothetical protein n=1 Tax=Magnetospirillum sp. LM-5 TaxID=2681466 RepID=UPI001570B75D|nr:hypothetical protein [Magnetospirillum sp. LM-5]
MNKPLITAFHVVNQRFVDTLQGVQRLRFIEAFVVRFSRENQRRPENLERHNVIAGFVRDKLEPIRPTINRITSDNLIDTFNLPINLFDKAALWSAFADASLCWFGLCGNLQLIEKTFLNPHVHYVVLFNSNKFYYLQHINRMCY